MTIPCLTCTAPAHRCNIPQFFLYSLVGASCAIYAIPSPCNFPLSTPCNLLLYTLISSALSVPFPYCRLTGGGGRSSARMAAAFSDTSLMHSSTVARMTGAVMHASSYKEQYRVLDHCGCPPLLSHRLEHEIISHLIPPSLSLRRFSPCFPPLPIFLPSFTFPFLSPCRRAS